MKWPCSQTHFHAHECWGSFHPMDNGIYLFVHSDSETHIIILWSIEGDQKWEAGNEMVEFTMGMDEHGVI